MAEDACDTCVGFVALDEVVQSNWICSIGQLHNEVTLLY